MMKAVDLVFYDDRDGPFTASPPWRAVDDAVRSGRRVLVVLRSADRRGRRGVRRSLAQALVAPGQLSIVINAEVACVDGVDRVEVVVFRYRTSGRLLAVNATAFVTVLSAPPA